MKKNASLLKRKLLNILILVLLVYSFTFLIFMIKLIIRLYEKREYVTFDWSIARELIIEFVMFALTALFAYICFQIRRNMKDKT